MMVWMVAMKSNWNQDEHKTNQNWMFDNAVQCLQLWKRSKSLGNFLSINK